MADSLLTEMQKAIVAGLKADPSVSNAVGERVYDCPPINPVYPFIRLGNVQSTPVDTYSGVAYWNVERNIEVHSDKIGRQECADISQHIMDAFHRKPNALAMVGFSVIDLVCETIAVQANQENNIASVMFLCMIRKE